jgi:hypothetical protein
MRRGKKATEIYRCVTPKCPHFLTIKELLPGRENICWKCSKEFIASVRNLTQRKPTCLSCRSNSSVKRIVIAQAARDITERLLNLGITLPKDRREDGEGGSE